jgi:hypothetical protein
MKKRESLKMPFGKILFHPGRKKIDRMLRGGVSVVEVSQRLREMYPGEKKLHLTPATLQKYRRKYLKVDGAAIRMVREIVKEKKEEKEKKNLINSVSPERSSIYKEKLKEALDVHIDIKQQLGNLSVLINSRIEDIFNRAQSGDASSIEEQNLQKYFQTYITVIERWAKYIDKVADHTVETNVNITVIEDQMAVIRECIRETFNEINPELAIKFFEKLERKMAMLSYRPPKQQTFVEMHRDVKSLVADVGEIIEIGEEDEQI